MCSPSKICTHSLESHCSLQALAEELSRRLRPKSASGLSADEFMQRAQQQQPQVYGYDSPPPPPVRTASAAAAAAAAAEAAWRAEESELEEPVLAQQPSALVSHVPLLEPPWGGRIRKSMPMTT